jgi:hypothetical protein
LHADFHLTIFCSFANLQIHPNDFKPTFIREKSLVKYIIIHFLNEPVAKINPFLVIWGMQELDHGELVRVAL